MKSKMTANIHWQDGKEMMREGKADCGSSLVDFGSDDHLKNRLDSGTKSRIGRVQARLAQQ